MGDALPIYHINRMIEETGKKFQDEAHIIYVNRAYRDKSPLGILMHDFSCTDPNDITYEVLAERVRYFKEDEEGVAAMCKAMEDMRNEAALEKAKRQPSICLCWENYLMKKLHSVRSCRWMK